MFTKSSGTWTRSETIFPPRNAPRSEFGVDIALQGDRALIAETYQDSENESRLVVRAYRKSGGTWSHRGVIWQSPIFEGNTLPSISLVDDIALIASSITRQIYWFKHTTDGWTKVAQLPASGPSEPRNYIAADSSSEYAVVGVPEDTSTAVSAGSAYLYRNEEGAWNHHTDLRPNDLDRGDMFGYAVAITDSHVLVSARDDSNPNGSGAGSAYLYSITETGVTQVKKFWAANSGSGSHYGITVGLDSGVSIVGATRAESMGTKYVGAAYLRTAADDWAHQYKLVDSQAPQGAYFGNAVAIDEAHVAIGATNHHGTSPGSEQYSAFDQAGAVFVVDRSALGNNS
ncbi:FG-GAP repeat protein [Haloarchaeobius iranensis]|uniref:FG-GAP repeat protein n=1 Tax=Haloarchaeobius iranensis TaxID=996166 RepID=UPI001587C00F|nr:hypothetical protein [Haloarchaeobius iranensis]